MKFKIFLILNLLTFPALAEKTKSDLNQVKQKIAEQKKEEKQIKKQEKEIKKEISQTQKKIVKVASNIREFEKTIKEMDEKLSDLEQRKHKLNTSITQNEDQVKEYVKVIENITRMPSGYLMLSSQPPKETIRSSVIIKKIITKLKSEIKEFEKKVNDLQNIEEEIKQKKEDLKKSYAKMKQEKNKFDKLLKTKKSEEKKIKTKKTKTAKKLKILIQESKSIQDFLKKAKQALKKETHDISEKDSEFYQGRGKMPYPAVGNIIHKYKEKVNDTTLYGMKIKTKNSAQVLSPYDGNIMFVGKLKGYDNIVIIEYDSIYHLVLGGIENIYAEEGRTVLAGEPIGEMGNSKNELYIELRYKNDPVNPAIYFKN
jgi:septal ring factor EnvC (AmiA/AmiB activator)